MIIIITIILVIAYSLYENYQILEKTCTKLFYENKTLRSRLSDLYDYKRDITKTFKILDNELSMISEHIQPIQQIRVKEPLNYVLDKTIMKDLIEEPQNNTLEPRNNTIEELQNNTIKEPRNNTLKTSTQHHKEPEIEELKTFNVQEQIYSEYKLT